MANNKVPLTILYPVHFSPFEKVLLNLQRESFQVIETEGCPDKEYVETTQPYHRKQ